MNQEIERKFLVKGDFKSVARDSFRVVQGYLSSVPERTVRIRIKGDKGYITVKGTPDPSGVSRFEWEKEIPLSESERLLQLCEPGLIEKTRYLVQVGTHTYEVDEFGGENAGLLLAEIELQHENEYFEKPDWLGEEVTGDMRYYNSMLSKRPFSGW